MKNKTKRNYTRISSKSSLPVIILFVFPSSSLCTVFFICFFIPRAAQRTKMRFHCFLFFLRHLFLFVLYIALFENSVLVLHVTMHRAALCVFFLNLLGDRTKQKKKKIQPHPNLFHIQAKNNKNNNNGFIDGKGTTFRTREVRRYRQLGQGFKQKSPVPLGVRDTVFFF